jgi:hypothetical protein
MMCTKNSVCVRVECCRRGSVILYLQGRAQVFVHSRSVQTGCTRAQQNNILSLCAQTICYFLISSFEAPQNIMLYRKFLAFLRIVRSVLSPSVIFR